MPALTPVELELIRHNLNTACHCLKPNPGKRQAFRQGLLALLLQTGEWPGEQEAGTYLAGILRHTCLAPDYETPRQNSSPVCYANTPGLREGFEAVDLPEEPPRLADGILSPATLQAAGAGLPEVLSATRNCIRQILSGGQGKLQAGSGLEKQTACLVDQFFGLPPADPPGIG